LYSGTDRITIETHKTNALAVQTIIESTRNTFLQNKSSLDTLKLAYDNAKLNLEVKKNPYTPEDILTQEAIVSQAQASVDSALAAYNKTILKAPFTGKITKIIPGVGDIVNTNSPVISIIGDDTYQIDINISESDIAKVKVNNTAKVTLDAYSSDIIFPAKVVQIDLSAIEIDGVVSYRSIVKFDNKDIRIMPGMTANIDVLALEKDDIMIIPSRAIITKNGKKFVKLMVGKNNVLTNVIVGIRGSDGNTEIISGIKVGDQIVSQ
jgi:HlyD family secretion protein